MADKKISQLDSTTSVNEGAMFPLSQTEGDSLKTVKGTADQIGDYIAKTQDHSTLNTVSKKIIGAINEILASGIGDIEETASGSVASFNDGGDNIPVKSLVADIVVSQAGSGTPSPSNPRAISGYTDVVIKNDVQGTTQATYTISLGSTVYGGTLDVTKGILTVTHTLLDMGSVDWIQTSVGDYSVYYYIPSDKDDTFDFICSFFNAVEKTRQNLSDLEMGTYNSTNAMNRLVVRYDAISTAADFKTAVTGQYVVYRLATPVVINLTPTEVRTLLGENNIYSNSGDVEIEYFIEDAKPIADLVETYIDATKSGSVHSYTASLTSSQYGWFTFVDEHGNNLLASVGIPLQATAFTDSKYYHGLFSQQTSGLWLFKVADINDSGNYKPIGTSLSNIQFNLSYIAL